MKFTFIILIFSQMVVFKNVLDTGKLLLQVALNDKSMSGFLVISAALWNMIMQNLQVDAFLFLALFILVGIDTFYGALLAKKRNEYDWKKLKSKTFVKLQGYVFFLLALFLLSIIVFVVGLRDGKAYISEYFLNWPIMTTFLFFGAIEFVSIKNNIVLYSGIKTPTKVIERVEDFIKNQDPTELNFSKNPNEK